MSCSSFAGSFEVEPRYYSDKNGEIDFVLQNGTESIPVEAKGGEDKSAPSFKRYIAGPPPGTRHPLFQAGVSQGRRHHEHPALSRQKNKRAAVTQIPSHTVRGDCLTGPTALSIHSHGGGPYIYASPRTERFLPIAPTSPPHKETVPPKHPPKSALPACEFWGRFFPDFYGFSTGCFLEIR